MFRRLRAVASVLSFSGALSAVACGPGDEPAIWEHGADRTGDGVAVTELEALVRTL
jgi:hypothetical protein